MSDSDGPVMLAATSVMRPGRTRIGKIGGNITLPRTVPLISLAAGGGGALLGIFVGLVLTGASFSGLLYGGVFGGAAGVFLVTYSPLQGESLLTWFGLTMRSRKRRVRIDGKVVTLSVGVFPIDRAPVGPMAIVRSAVRVPPGQYDERGVLISAENRNIDLGDVPVAAKPTGRGRMARPAAAMRRDPRAAAGTQTPAAPPSTAARLPRDSGPNPARPTGRSLLRGKPKNTDGAAGTDGPLQLPPARKLKD